MAGLYFRKLPTTQKTALKTVGANLKITQEYYWQEIDKKNTWQAFLKANPTWAENCLQSFNWGLAYQKLGGQIARRVLFNHQQPIAGYTALVETGRWQRFLSLAGGPLLDWEDPIVLQSFKKDICQIARQYGCFFIRLRPQVQDSPAIRQALKSINCRLAPAHLSVELAGILDLNQSDQVLRQRFNKSIRHKIRNGQADKALKIKVSRNLKDAVLFAKIHQDHARRFKYGAFSQKKLINQFETFVKDDQVLLYLAYRRGQLLAANMVFFYGQEASHLFGVSTPLGQKHASAPLLHLAAIKEARHRGLKIYNFWGIVEPHQTKHRYYGLSQFKRGFGVEAYQYTPSHDLVVNFLAYTPLWLYQTLLRKYRRL